MSKTKQYDYLNRLSSISSVGAGFTPSVASLQYQYNDANQRTRVSLEDGSFWIYQYDKLGQVTFGKRYWSDWTRVAGQQFEYSFDDIGNRTSTKAGGDANGSGLLSANYSANSLNQYTSRDVPGAVDLIGVAHANATVTVNGQSRYRRGEFFWQKLSVNNSSAAVWQSVTNIGSLSGTNQTNTGNLFLPKTAEGYTCDADGNRTSDGRWTNKWDGENRLVDISSLASGPSASRKSLQFAYDSQGRRYSKIVSNWTGSAWTRALHELYLYDGWNLLAALNGTNQAIVKSFLWGLDLSGSMQGAGGVGGLVAFASRQSPVGTYFVAYDGNGNVMALVDGSSGSLSARYEYDPFGQTIRCSGTPGTLNPVRFSSKHLDDETDLAYYGYRYLNPSAGRWLSRDPIQQRGGVNESSFAFNSPIYRYDILGRACGPMAVTDLGHRDSITNVNADGSLDVSSGHTDITSWVMSTVVERCFPGFSTCQFKVRIRACWASVAYYYDNSTSDKTHEEIHKKEAVDDWDILVSTAEALVGNCYSQRKATCYQSAIDQYSEAYHLAWFASGYELDCSTYSTDQNSRYCVSARDYRRRADDAMARANQTVSRCQSTP